MFRPLLPLIFLIYGASLGAEELELPFVLDARKPALLVQVEIGDRAATLLLDTGSAHTILRPEIVGLTRFDLNKARFNENAIGMHVRGLWALTSIRLAGRRIERKVAIVDFDLASHYEARIDGLLGHDLLGEYKSVTIDFDRGKLILRR